MKFYSGLLQSKQSSARRPKLHGTVVILEFELFILSGFCLFFFYSILYIYVAAEKTTAKLIVFPKLFFLFLLGPKYIYIEKSNTNISFLKLNLKKE